MSLFIPLNDSSVYCIAIVSDQSTQQFTTTTKAQGAILASDVLYAFPDKLNYQGTVGTYMHVVVGNGGVAPIDYWFNTATISGFTTFLSGASVTTTYTTYPNCTGLKGFNTFPTPISILVNDTAIDPQSYNPQSNIAIFNVRPGSKNYPQYSMQFLGNPQVDGAAATASLAVPIAAVTQAVKSTGTASVTVGTVAAGDHLTITKNSIPYLYVTVGGDTAATILANTLGVLNTNTQGDTWTGVNTTGALVFTATNTLAHGATVNGQTIAVAITGTTFSANSGSTTSGGVTQTGTGDTITGYIQKPSLPSPTSLGVVTVVPGSTQATLKTATDALFNSNTLGFAFVGSLSGNVDTLAGTAPTKGSYYNGWKVYFVPTGTTFGTSTVTATFASGV